MKLRVEESPPAVIAAPLSPPMVQDVDHWRRLAIQTGERLQYAETQLVDLRKTADELRARMTKANERRENAQAKANELQVQVVNLTAERDRLQAELDPLKDVRRKAYDLLEDAQQRLLESTT